MHKDNAHVYFTFGVRVGNMVVVATIFNYRYGKETGNKKEKGQRIR